MIKPGNYNGFSSLSGLLKYKQASMLRDHCQSLMLALAIRWPGADSHHPWCSPCGQRFVSSKLHPWLRKRYIPVSLLDPIEFVAGENLSGTDFDSFSCPKGQYMEVLHPKDTLSVFCITLLAH